jgi:hypothetical protein
MHAHSSQLKRFVCAHVCMFELASCEIQHWEKKRQCLCVSLVQHTCAFIITKDVCHVCVFFLCVCARACQFDLPEWFIIMKKMPWKCAGSSVFCVWAR